MTEILTRKPMGPPFNLHREHPSVSLESKKYQDNIFGSKLQFLHFIVRSECPTKVKKSEKAKNSMEGVP